MKTSGEKRPTRGSDGNNLQKLPYSGLTSRPASPLQKGKQRKKKDWEMKCDQLNG